MYRRLRDLREDNDYKQSDIAKILNMTQQQYSKIEKGIQYFHRKPVPLSCFRLAKKKKKGHSTQV